MYQQIMCGYFMALINNLVPSAWEYNQWLLAVTRDKDIAPIWLCLRKQVIHLKSLFFFVEYVDNDTNKHVKDEQGSNNHE